MTLGLTAQGPADERGQARADRLTERYCLMGSELIPGAWRIYCRHDWLPPSLGSRALHSLRPIAAGFRQVYCSVRQSVSPSVSQSASQPVSHCLTAPPVAGFTILRIASGDR